MVFESGFVFVSFESISFGCGGLVSMVMIVIFIFCVGEFLNLLFVGCGFGCDGNCLFDLVILLFFCLLVVLVEYGFVDVFDECFGVGVG